MTQETKSTVVTAFSQFYRAMSVLGEYRFYPYNQNGKEAARNFGGDYTVVSGFGVYDTTVSTAYAVMLYGTQEEAESYVPVAAPTPPETIFESEPPATPLGGFEAEGFTPEPFDNPMPKKNPSSRGGFGRR